MKVSQKDADYRPAEDPAVSCATCDYYMGENACEVVAGVIGEDMVSAYWEAEGAAAAMANAEHGPAVVKLGRVPVRGYLRRGEGGDIEQVRAHTRFLGHDGSGTEIHVGSGVRIMAGERKGETGIVKGLASGGGISVQPSKGGEPFLADPDEIKVTRQVKMSAELGPAVAKLARVVVPPYLREKSGKIEDVEGYTYNRQGGLAKLVPAKKEFHREGFATLSPEEKRAHLIAHGQSRERVANMPPDYMNTLHDAVSPVAPQTHGLSPAELEAIHERRKRLSSYPPKEDQTYDRFNVTDRMGKGLLQDASGVDTSSMSPAMKKAWEAQQDAFRRNDLAAYDKAAAEYQRAAAAPRSAMAMNRVLSPDQMPTSYLRKALPSGWSTQDGGKTMTGGEYVYINDAAGKRQATVRRSIMGKGLVEAVTADGKRYGPTEAEQFWKDLRAGFARVGLLGMERTPTPDMGPLGPIRPPEAKPGGVGPPKVVPGGFRMMKTGPRTASFQRSRKGR